MNPAFNRLKKSYSQIRSDLRMAAGTLVLIKGLREFFRETITLEQATEEIKIALDSREERFLELIRAEVYNRKSSPYLKLFHMAGCDFADLQAHVRQHGLEKTLERLASEGVFLTSDEFKGKKEVVRGRQAFRISPTDLQLQASARGLILNQSSGTSGQAQRYPLSLDRLVFVAHSISIFFSAHDLFDYAHAIYDAPLPSDAAIRHLLTFGKSGVRVDRWFARQVPMGAWPEAAYHHLMTYLIVLAVKRFGPGAPSPEFVDAEEPHRIVDWITDKKPTDRPRCVRTTASNAVRIVRAALALGRSVAGTKFIVSGEPLTESKRHLIENAGGIAIPGYGCAGLGHIGYGCANPLYTDEVHLSQDKLVTIRHPRPSDCNGQAIRPFLFSTLSPLVSNLHLNVENGDFGNIDKRPCGCALDQAGLSLHLHNIRSFEKLTGEGMSYAYGDLYELLEKIFPAEFGGGPGDYQLVEEEDSMGQTRLTLVVHPEVEELDESRALARLRSALANGSRGNRFMTGVWEKAGTFRVKRQLPYASARGKILPLHISHARPSSPP